MAARPSVPLTAVEYFAGIGLFRMGLEAAGWKVLYSNDWNPEREKIYRGFFSEPYSVRDIFELSPDKIPQATLATCSFPCVDLSLAGKQGGINGKHSGAFWGFYDILKKQGKHAPPVVLLENVAGWLSSNNGEDFRAVGKALNRLGYECDVFALNARSFVPQSRPRLFFIGVKTPPKIKKGNFSELRSPLMMPEKLRAAVEKNPDIRWRHWNLSPPPPHKSVGLSKSVIERISDDDPRWWSQEKVDKHLSMMSAPHLRMVQKMAAQPSLSYRTFFRRRRQDGQRAEVRPDDIAGCLRTAIGGSGKQFLVASGGGGVRMRTLTARECARLQGVPDKLPISATSERQALNAFGDAVCVPVVEWIARNVLTPIAACV